MVTLIKSYSSLVRKRRKQLSETKSLYTTVRDHIKQFELKKFARRANINVSKITSKNPATWLGLSKSDKELNKQKRESVNQRYTAAQISGQEPKWAQYRFEAAPKSTPPPGKELDYMGVGIMLQRFFEDILFSRTNSNGAYRIGLYLRV